MDASQAFAAQVEPHLPGLVDDVLDIAKNKKLKVALRLSAMKLLFERVVPTRKSVDTNFNQQVNVFYMSPQEVAAARLSGVETPLNDLAKIKRIELSDLPQSFVGKQPELEDFVEPEKVKEETEI